MPVADMPVANRSLPADAAPPPARAALPLDAQAAYRALVARDARFDGRLFVGVTSTGIYCRPVCRVRAPRRENCRFFGTHALAEAAGFRPCLKCRPEIAPGLSHTDSSRTLAGAAEVLLQRAVRDAAAVSLPDVAARLGVTDRHLRRIFTAAHGVSPQAYVTVQRLLLAKQLLTDTTEPITQVALASGFTSVRRFNAAFAEHCHLSPTRVRASARSGRRAGDEPLLRLAYRPPYDVDAALRFLAVRAVPSVEEIDVERGSWRRTLSITQRGQRLDGWFACRFEPTRHEVHVQVAPALAPALGALIARVRQSLDLDADPQPLERALAGVPAPAMPGVRLIAGPCGFESAVRVVLGQQVTVKAARTLLMRLVERFGRELPAPAAAAPCVTRLFPDATTLADASAEAIGTLGIVRQRVRALQALAAAVCDGTLDLQPGAPLEPTLAALRALPGIGEWSAQVIALRALAWPDAWTASDIGLMNALGTRDAREVIRIADAWRPWRSYALMQLWHAIEPRA